ncbi:hypothetical protein PCK2_000740 [Pneumocystis canis]|nr:hypothetical protein PCK2_000740 [Pneumocystis canis]
MFEGFNINVMNHKTLLKFLTVFIVSIKRSTNQRLSDNGNSEVSYSILAIKSFLRDDILFPLFVTWNIIDPSGYKSLRGCIGTFKPQPLKHGLCSYALTSVTLLTDFETIDDPLDWTIGLHAEEQNWTKEETLNNLLIKAGINGDTFDWRQINMKDQKRNALMMNI